MTIHRSLWMLGKVIVLVPAMVVSLAAQTMPVDLTPDQVRTMMKDTNTVVLDVRSQGEYAEERIGNTPLMPLQFLERRIADLNIYKKKKIIVYCYSGNRSELAVEILREYGFTAYNMEGGIIRWKARRFPTISGGTR